MIKVVEKLPEIKEVITEEELIEKGIPKYKILACKHDEHKNKTIRFFIENSTTNNRIIVLNSSFKVIDEYESLDLVLYFSYYVDFVLLKRKEISKYIVDNEDGALHV